MHVRVRCVTQASSFMKRLCVAPCNVALAYTLVLFLRHVWSGKLVALKVSFMFVSALICDGRTCLRCWWPY